MDAEKSKKLQQYAVTLTEQAREEEKNGKPDEAIKHYLKLVDVFLVLAAEAQDHNTWLQYIRQAEAYQTRTRALIPKEGGQAVEERIKPVENSIPKIQRPSVPPPTSSSSSSNNIQATDSRSASPLRKILKPFQKTGIEEEERHSPNSEIRPSNQVMNAVQRQPSAPNSIPSQPVRAPASAAATNPTPVDSSVSAEVYQRVLSENKSLRDKLSQVMKEKEEKISALERQKAELEERNMQMVPRADYEALQYEFENSVPKSEYERIRSELLGKVPKEHYDDLLNRISTMVPRDLYLEAERRALVLEGTLKNSVPKELIDDLASEVSLLGVLSEVPLDTKSIEAKEEENEANIENV